VPLVDELHLVEISDDAGAPHFEGAGASHREGAPKGDPPSPAAVHREPHEAMTVDRPHDALACADRVDQAGTRGTLHGGSCLCVTAEPCEQPHDRDSHDQHDRNCPVHLLQSTTLNGVFVTTLK
jgi:hypothetical protein